MTSSRGVEVSLVRLGCLRVGLAGLLYRLWRVACGLLLLVLALGHVGGWRAGCFGDGVACMLRCFCCAVSGVGVDFGSLLVWW